MKGLSPPFSLLQYQPGEGWVSREVPLVTAESWLPRLAFTVGWACGVCFWSGAWSGTRLPKTLSSRPPLPRVLGRVGLAWQSAGTHILQLYIYAI